MIAGSSVDLSVHMKNGVVFATVCTQPQSTYSKSPSDCLQLPNQPKLGLERCLPKAGDLCGPQNPYRAGHGTHL